MTLIVALGNTEQVIQISDRRLTYDGKLIDDESNKCGVLFCLNARMAFGFTGLARWKKFETTKWLLKALHNSAEPDYTIGEILERLKQNATETFKLNDEIKNIDIRFKRLAIMFSGYINLNGVYKQGCAILSNYHDFKNNSAFSYAQDEFHINYSSASKGVEMPTLVQRVGNWSEMSSEDINVMRSLLLAKKPSSAIIGKSIELIREIADRPKSSGTIGKQLTSISIPFDLNKGVSSNYYSAITKPETYMPALVYLLPGQHMTVDNISITPVEKDTKPISVPKVGRNNPCPCGSGLKYKHCHGKH